jgi:hypothetical protein
MPLPFLLLSGFFGSAAKLVGRYIALCVEFIKNLLCMAVAL